MTIRHHLPLGVLLLCTIAKLPRTSATESETSAKSDQGSISRQVTPRRTDVKPFEYVDVGAKIPNYTPSKKWGVQGEPKTRMQKPLAPEESVKHFVTPNELRVLRYADERDFQSKPIAMTWDQRGRLWICETLDYPNELGKNRDRIRICEDTDGDAIADRFTVFAEGLSIPTALVIIRGGAVVQNGTETIYLKDTDGDDVADERSTLISGWALGDTHGGVSNFRYGLDNWIWAMQGYNRSTPRIDETPVQSFRQGFFRFKLSQTDPPVVTELEFIRSSDNNTWGLGISEEGLIFGSTANRNPSMFMPIANRYYERVRGWAAPTLHSIAETHRFDPITEDVRQVDHHGGYTAGAGHALYTARAFPMPWWNRTAFVAGPTGHLVGTFVLRPDGANFTSHSPLNLIASDDEWSAPIMAEVGPDGAVWVLDWYNYIVQHNPTPNGFETGKGAAYQSDLRDKRHGRIYRVVPRDENKIHGFSNLEDENDGELVRTLQHPSMRWRLHAQRLLIERDSAAKPEVRKTLIDLVNDKSVDPIGLNVGAIHALHVLHGSNIDRSGPGQSSIQSSQLVDAELVDVFVSALRHPSAGVRRNALLVLPVNEQGLQGLMAHQELFRDEAAQVRLQAILVLADMPSSVAAGDLIAELASSETDPVLIDALTSAAAKHAVPFLESIVQLPLPPARESNTDVADHRVLADKDATHRIARRVSEHLARGKPNAATLTQIIASLSSSDPTLAISILDGLTTGLPDRSGTAFDPAWERTLKQSFREAGFPVQVSLLRLATRVGTDVLDSDAPQIIDSLTDTLSDEDAEASERLAAAGDLIVFRRNDTAAVSSVLDAITPRTAPRFAVELLSRLKQSDARDTGRVLLESLNTLSPMVKTAAIDVVLTKPAWAESLLSSSEAGDFDLDQLSPQQKQSLRALPDAAMQARAEQLLARDGGLPNADRERVLQSLMHLTKLTGDVQSGRAVFKKVCANCHQHGDLGQKIGPNLTGMATHAKSEWLTHILDPSRNVEGNYRLYNVLTNDGVVINGMLAGESKTAITIVDANAKEVSVPRDEIERLVASRKSVMPDGFEQQLSESELADLLEFLTQIRQ